MNSVNTFGSGGKANHNMLLAGIKHQFSHTFSVEAQYTWAKSMDTDSGPYSRDAYLYDPRLSYGRSDFDIRNGFKAFGVWEPVFFHGNNFAEKVVGGFTLSGILTLHSGYGWTPVYTEPHQIYCNTCNYGYQSLRPYYLGKGGHDTNNNAFKNATNFPGYDPNKAQTAAFAQTGTNNNLFLNNYFYVPDYSAAITDGAGQATNNYVPAPGIGRNSMPGPGYRNVDLTIAKAFGFPKMRVLGEGAKFEIKANIFNAFNLLNITPNSLSTNIGNAGLGQANSALGSRTIDFQGRFSF